MVTDLQLNQDEDEMFFLSSHPDYDDFFDCFCGGGGSGTGIIRGRAKMQRKGRGTFVNHHPPAIDCHQANHPEHRHLREDLFLLEPEDVMPRHRRYGFGWASPSCVQFSISRGNRPINEQNRSHADTLIKWVLHCNPEVLMIENVKEFKDWGPLRQRRDKKTKELQWAREYPGRKKGKTVIKPCHKLPAEHLRQPGEAEAEWELRLISLEYHRHLEPDPARKGEYFQEWREKIEKLGPGYVSDFRLLRGADYGSPTIRIRLFGQFVRKDTGKRIVWPDQRFIKPGAKRPAWIPEDRELLPWPTARDNVIQWDIKGESVFSRDKKLAAATMRRMAIGLVKFALKEFLVPAQNFGGGRVRDVTDPLQAVATNARGEGLAVPQMEALRLTSNKGFDAGVRPTDVPEATMTTNARGEAVFEGQGAFLTPNFGERPTQTPRTHDLSEPAPTATSHGAGGLCQPELTQLPVDSFLLTKQGLNPHMNEPRPVDDPAPTAITDGRVHLAEVAASFILPKDQGHLQDYVTSVDYPCTAVQTTAHDHLVNAEASIIQLNGQSDAISIKEPLGSVTGCVKQHLMEPCIAKLRGTNTANGVNEPMHTVSAGGTHHMLVEPEGRVLNDPGLMDMLADGFLMAMDNAGKNGENQRAYSPDEPVKTIPVKANQTLVQTESFILDNSNVGPDEKRRERSVYSDGTPLRTLTTESAPSHVEFTLESLEDCIRKSAPDGADASRAIALLEPLMEELKKIGRADIKPWIYVYYGSGAVGADITTPVPTIRTKEGTAICYPVLEFDGVFLKLDIFYRMLTVLELQRAQGFPDDFIWPEGMTKSEKVKAIGNSVCCDVAEALTLAYYSQKEDISEFFLEDAA